MYYLVLFYLAVILIGYYWFEGFMLILNMLAYYVYSMVLFTFYVYVTLLCSGINLYII